MSTNSFSHLETSLGDSLILRFLAAERKLIQIGAAVGFRIVPTTDPTLPLFAKLPAEAQARVVNTLEVSCKVYGAMMAEGLELRSPSAVIWSVFRELGLLPPGDFFDKISSEDVIQLYSPEGFHLFTNFRFFELCSYTLEEVYCLPWTQLWSRGEAELAKIALRVQAVLAPDQTKSICINEPPHLVSELASAFKFDLKYSMRCIAPLWDRVTRARAGLIVIEQVEIVSERNIAEEERALAELVPSGEFATPMLTLV